MKCLVVIAHPVHDIVDGFPMTVTGKIRKFMLRNRLRMISACSPDSSSPRRRGSKFARAALSLAKSGPRLRGGDGSYSSGSHS